MSNPKEIMNNFFNVIDADSSPALSTDEIGAATFFLIAGCETEEEKTAVSVFFLCLAQLSQKLEAEGKEKCSKADWVAFDAQPPPGIDAETFGSAMTTFLGIAKMCNENKESLRSALQVTIASDEFKAFKAEKSG